MARPKCGIETCDDLMFTLCDEFEYDEHKYDAFRTFIMEIKLLKTKRSI